MPQHDDMLDAALQWVIDNSNRLYICSQKPTTYTQATSTYALGYIDISSADFTGPANGVTSGRRITVDENTLTILTAGTALAYALVDTSTSKLCYPKGCPPYTVEVGTATMSAWDIEIRDDQSSS